MTEWQGLPGSSLVTRDGISPGLAARVQRCGLRVSVVKYE